MGRCHMQSTAMIWEMTRENPLLVWSSVNPHWKGWEADVCFIYLNFDSNGFQTFYESIDIPKRCLQKQSNTRSNESGTYCKPIEMRKFYWPETIPFQISGALKTTGMLHYHELSIWTTWFLKIPHRHVFLFVISSPYQFCRNCCILHDFNGSAVVARFCGRCNSAWGPMTPPSWRQFMGNGCELFWTCWSVDDSPT